MTMKKTALASAMLLSLGATGAQALSIQVTTMQFYDVAGTAGFVNGSLNTSVVGSVNDSVTGAIDSGTTRFLGLAWTATQATWDDNHSGPGNWSGSTASGAFSYNYTLTGNQVAVGLLFNWGVSTDIAVLQIFDCPDGAAGACVGVHNDSSDDLTFSLHADHPGVPGSVMGNGPIADQHLTFRGTTQDIIPQSGTPEIPVPAAVWLFGSGLLGLVGVARRKKQA